MAGGVVLVGVCYADGAPLDGRYLESFDPEYGGGLGRAWWTDDIAGAKRFTDFNEAVEFWRQTSRTKPFREDGRPNRPLTAVTVTFENI